MIEIEAEGEMAVLKNVSVGLPAILADDIQTVNSMVRQLTVFANEVTRVALEVGTQGILGGQAVVPGVEGVWDDLTTNVNVSARNLDHVGKADHSTRKWPETLLSKCGRLPKS